MATKDEVAGILEYFVKNFLYVLVFHFSIIAAVYVNLKVLITPLPEQKQVQFVSALCCWIDLIDSLIELFAVRLFHRPVVSLPLLYLLFQDLGTRFNCGVLSDFHQCSIFDLAICPDAHCQNAKRRKMNFQSWRRKLIHTSCSNNLNTIYSMAHKQRFANKRCHPETFWFFALCTVWYSQRDDFPWKRDWNHSDVCWPSERKNRSGNYQG